jgi:hypothetical protein
MASFSLPDDAKISIDGVELGSAFGTSLSFSEYENAIPVAKPIGNITMELELSKKTHRKLRFFFWKMRVRIFVLNLLGIKPKEIKENDD